MTVEEQLQRLTGIVDALASTVVAHDNQIESLIQVAEKHNAQIEAHERRTEGLDRRTEGLDRRIEALLRSAEKHDAQIAALAEQIANTERQWQAYVNRLPRQ